MNRVLASASSKTLMPLSEHPHSWAISAAVAPAHVPASRDSPGAPPEPCLLRYNSPSFVKMRSSMADFTAAFSWTDRMRCMKSSGDGPPAWKTPADVTPGEVQTDPSREGYEESLTRG